MAQLSFEDAQILHLSFDDEDDLSYTDYDFELTEEVAVEADEGKYGGGAYFDGAGSWIVFEPLEGFNHGLDWTWSTWLKTESTEDFWGIMSFGTYSGDPMTDWYDEEERVGGVIFSSFEGIFEVQISWLGWAGPDGQEPTPWNDGEWHHLVITYSVENEAMRIYVDNTLAGQEEAPFNFAVDIEEIIAEEGLTEASLEDDHIKLGFAGQGWLDEDGEKFPEIMFYEGFMDDFRLFNVALSEEEISELYAYAPTGIGDVSAKEYLSVYPNPASDFIHIETENKVIEASIYNLAGQKVISSFNETKIDVSSLTGGLYFLEVETSNSRGVEKLIVE